MRLAARLGILVALLDAAGGPGGGSTAWADGAFPDSFGPLLPRSRPHQIMLATNFGLVTSEDGGAS